MIPRSKKKPTILKPNRGKPRCTKYARRVRDFAYLRWIRENNWCLLCEQYGSETGSRAPQRTEAAHTGTRGLRQKGLDRDAIPLCRRHHQSGPDSYHRLGKNFAEHHKLDIAAIIERLHAAYRESGGVLAKP